MKAVVAVLVGVVILAAGFGIYRWQSGDDERGRAEAAARAMEAYCRRQGARCEVLRVEPISDGVWRLRYAARFGRPDRCSALDLDKFRVTKDHSLYVGGTIEGTSEIPCGPEEWTVEDVVSRLGASVWARERRADVVACRGRDKWRGSTYARRFVCSYGSPRGDGFVGLATTGADTFAIEAARYCDWSYDGC
jgi:hypothetical protein